MGREAWVHDYTVEDCLRISIFKLRKMGMFKASAYTVLEWENEEGEIISSAKATTNIRGDKCGNTMRLEYSVHSKNGRTDKKYEYDLLTTNCNYGGFRYWFKCLLCDRRVGKLYKPPGYTEFRCRHCYNLTYHSCRHEYWAFRLARMLGYKDV